MDLARQCTCVNWCIQIMFCLNKSVLESLKKTVSLKINSNKAHIFLVSYVQELHKRENYKGAITFETIFFSPFSVEEDTF